MKELNNCHICGARLKDQQDKDGEGLYCPECDDYRYMNPKPVAGTLVVDGEEVLLIKRGHEPNKGTWSFPAGYVDHDEDMKEAALRELNEETGLSVQEEDTEMIDTIQMEHETHYVTGIILGASREHTDGSLNPSDDAADAQYWSKEEMIKSSSELEGEHVTRVASKAIEKVRKHGCS